MRHVRQRRCVGSADASEAPTHRDHTVCVDTDECKDPTHNTGNNHGGSIPWTAWDGTTEIQYNDNTAYVYLTDDVTWDSLPQYTYSCLNVAENYTLYLCLNGHNLTAQYNNAQQIIYVSGTLILSDCRGTGTIAHGTGENMLGVGVKVTSGGTFKMYGGTISDNESTTSNDLHYGGGVHVRGTDGTFEMYRGTITRNNASGTCSGGGVGIRGGKFIMHDGNITGNMAASTNNVNGGGGVYVISSGTFEMTNGTIGGNQANGSGGGVYFRGGSSSLPSLTISGSAKIENNLAAGNGGVYVDGVTFNVSGGISIAGNKGGCTADANGDLTGGKDSNVYLTSNTNGTRYITVAGELTGAPIGVTTEAIPDSSNCVPIATGNQNVVDPGKFKYENSSTISISPVNGVGTTVNLVVCVHQWDTDNWETDNSNHWHKCLICGGKDKEIAHVYDREVAKEAYFKSAANCQSGTIYYKSCVCGKKGTETDTFPSGAVDPNTHTGFQSGWQSDDTNHWKVYSCCQAEAEKAAHSGGEATCTAQAECEVCGQPYGNVLGHDWADAICTDPKTCKRDGCGATDGEALGHEWGRWVVTKPATEDAAGRETRVCRRDSSHLETRCIPKLTPADDGCSMGDDCPLTGYGDLTPTAWYHDGVHYCIENGLMQGVSTGEFQPGGPATRALLVMILWRLEGRPEAAGTSSFSDVADGAWYAEAVRWAAENGVVKGYDNGCFGPNDTVTREQMVTILYRYAQYKGRDVSAGEGTEFQGFTDAAEVSGYAEPAMRWACGAELMTGIAQDGGMALMPKDTTTRAQVATLMLRFLK